MATIYPFRALRPRPDLAAEVASVPYDVVNRDEAAALAAGNPNSFLHVTRPEIDMDAGVDSHGTQVYQQGADALKELIKREVLLREAEPRLYLYQLSFKGHTQTGIALCASIAEYNRNEVRKHEFTRPDKEDDRTHHMQVLGAQSGIVFLTHRDSEAISAVVKRVSATVPEIDFMAPDEVQHRCWPVSETPDIDALVAGFADNGPLYIADGHHRSAAAARVAKDGRGGDGFLAVSFPVSEMNILPYNRVVHDLAGADPEAFMEKLRESFEIEPGKRPSLAPRQFHMFLGDKWFHLTAKSDRYDEKDPVGRLDVSILQTQVLGPLLNINDPRRDTRISFVGGIRGDAELERLVGDGAAVAFAMHPTQMRELLDIAEAGEVMPPKSTWFEPKLRDGLFVNLLDA